MTMDADVQSHARTLAQRSPDHLRIGPFTVRHNPDWQLKYANYAIPDQGAEPTAADVQALIAAFRERDRMPRLEFLPGGAPAVEPVLLAAGFTVENRAPILACALGDLLPPKPVDALVIAEPATDAEFDAAARVQHHGYGGTGNPRAARRPGCATRRRAAAWRPSPPWTASRRARAAARSPSTASPNWPVSPSPTRSAAAASAPRSPRI